MIPIVEEEESKENGLKNDRENDENLIKQKLIIEIN